MPKMKTKSGAKKRFKITGTGKAMRAHSGLRHGMVGKSRRRKRKLVGFTVVAEVDQARVLRMLGKR
ncbi:MAG: 50S ribosomal protein L35 [Candidatus Eiseniibacteriota bacterium]